MKGMLTCAECGAPASVEYETNVTGVDFDGADALFVVRRVRCAAGHGYTEIDEERTVRW